MGTMKRMLLHIKKHQNVSLTYEIKEDNYRSIVRVDTLFDNE